MKSQSWIILLGHEAVALIVVTLTFSSFEVDDRDHRRETVPPKSSTMTDSLQRDDKGRGRYVARVHTTRIQSNRAREQNQSSVVAHRNSNITYRGASEFRRQPEEEKSSATKNNQLHITQSDHHHVVKATPCRQGPAVLKATPRWVQ